MVSIGMAALDGVDVLLIEDDDDSRELLQMGLEMHGATVTSVADADATFRALTSWRPHVIISDLELADVDGYTILQMIRANPRLAGVCAIALSGQGALADRTRSLAAGYQKHLLKPARLEDIISAISSLRAGPCAESARLQPDLRGVLEELARVSESRFTSLLRFAEDDRLVSLWTYDRENPEADPYPIGLPIHASYCVLVRAAGDTVAIEHAAVDVRAIGHAKRLELGCYVGAPLFYRDGRMFGTVCCYEEEPRPFSPDLVREVERSARRLEPDLWRLFEPRR